MSKGIHHVCTTSHAFSPTSNDFLWQDLVEQQCTTRIWLLHRPDVQTLIDIKYVTHTEQYLVPLALNPQSKIPLLVFNEADSPIKSLHESAVILQFLDSKYRPRTASPSPQTPPYWKLKAAANYPNTQHWRWEHKVSLADFTLLPTLVFCKHFLPLTKRMEGNSIGEVESEWVTNW